MSGKTTTEKAYAFSYRYVTPDGQKKMTKGSLDRSLYERLVNVIGSATETHDWLISASRNIREKKEKDCGGYLREFATMKILGPELVVGYMISPKYHVLYCKNSLKGTTVVKIPEALFHAVAATLGKKYDPQLSASEMKNDHPEIINKFISKQYAEMRKNSDENTNYSSELRDSLIDYVLISQTLPA